MNRGYKQRDQRSLHARQTQLVGQIVLVLFELLLHRVGQRSLDLLDLKYRFFIVVFEIQQ